MPQLDEQDNLGVDVEDVDGAQGNPDGSDNQDNADFLVVNDRTRFKSQEDAIKSFNEAGERIAQLSNYEKELARYGVSDPRTATQLFDELIQLRQKQADAEKAAKSAEAGKGTASTHTDDDEGLSKEDADALKWLKKFAPRLGYISKDELSTTVEGLKAELKAAQEGNQNLASQYEEATRQTFVDSGRESVKGWMGEQKIEDAGGQKIAIIEGIIRDWANDPTHPERVSRFYSSPSESRSLVKEGFEYAVKALGWGKAGNGSTSASASYAQSKGSALARNGKRMPTNGPANRSGKPAPEVRTDAGGRKDFIGSAHNKAWEIASKHFAGTSGE